MRPDDVIAKAIGKAVADMAKRAARGKDATIPAEYRGRDSEGKPWVLFPGADDPTPVRRMSVEASIGDTVSATVGDGRVVVDANISNPSAGLTGVEETARTAESAKSTANSASRRATEAGSAAAAATSHADEAGKQAERATRRANEASDMAQSAHDSAETARVSADSAVKDAATARASAESAVKDAAIAHSAADEAVVQAGRAFEAAESAVEDAYIASVAAEEAKSEAAEAKQSAHEANVYSNAALDQLGIVQDVVGVLDWVTEHGRFVRTKDLSPQPNKVYYAFDTSAGDYAPVAVPREEDMALYYELEVDEAIQGFIMKHLAVTNRGLWVVPSGIDAQSEAYLVDDQGNQVVDDHGNPVMAVVNEVQYSSGYKVLLSNDGMYVYDPDGVMVTKFGENIEFSSLRSQYIGNEDAYIAFTPATAHKGASIDIGGDNVTLGSSRTLSEVLADVGTALQPDDVTVSQNPTQTGYDVTIGSNTFSLLNGRGVSSSVVKYGKSDSASVQPSSWEDNPPSSLEAGKWLWVRTVQTFTDSTTTTTYTKSYAGSDGTSVTILGSYASYADLVAAHPTGNVGDSYIVAGDLYVWDAANARWSDVGTIQGPPGDSVTVSSIEYGKSLDPSTQPSSWSGTFPQLDQGDWLWVKTTYSDASETLTKSYVGTDGEDGMSVAVKSSTKTGGVTTVVLESDDGTETTLTIADGEDGDEGEPGADGKTVHIAWATSADGTEGFSTSVSAGKTYIGVYTDVSLVDSQRPRDYSWSLIKGEKGDPGVGINSWTVSYGQSDSPATVPTDWQSTIPSVPEGHYLWTMTVTDYTDPSVQDTVSYTYSRQGSKGDRGQAGTSVTVSSITYQTGANASAAPTGEWRNAPYDTTASLPYLWTKTAFSDGKVAYGVAKRGADGQPGQDGASAYSYVRYSKNASGNPMTLNPQEDTLYVGFYSGDSSTVPSYTKFSWSRYVGEDGQKGAQGKSVTSVRTQHYLSTSDQSPQGDEWVYTPKEYVRGRWYWKREEVGWDDNGTASTTWTTPVIDRALNQAFSRIANAEMDINNLEGSVALKADAEDVYTKEQTTAYLEVKANKDTLTSEINASADTVQIDADRVDIAGAALFTSGRLSESSLNGAYDSKGSAATAKTEAISAAASDATSKANAAQAAAESTASADATSKANAAEANAKQYADGKDAAISAAQSTANGANAREQLVYRSAADGTTGMAAVMTWVTDSTGGQGKWTARRPEYSRAYPVLFVAVQRQTVAQLPGSACSCTTPAIDDTTTVIDGGHIITNSVTAEKLAAASVTADKLDAGAVTADKIAARSVTGDKLAMRSISVGALAEDVTNRIESVEAAASDAAGLSYDSSWELITDLTAGNRYYAFTASARKGGVDITDDLPDEFFTWHLRTEDGTESFLGNGKEMDVQASSAGYHATVVGGLEEQVGFAVATSSGGHVVDEQGRRLIGIWKA